MKIFLDLDGVIVDWDRGVIEWFGLNATHDDITHWGSMYELSGMTEHDFWEDLATPLFWENLMFTPIAFDLLKLLTIWKPCLLTSPAMKTAGWRQNWIQKNLPSYFHSKRYLIGPGKQYCASPDAILIDDYEENIKLFESWGGRGLLFPQPWNYLRDIKTKQDKLDYVEKQLRKLT